jgi:hypothetical protein
VAAARALEILRDELDNCMALAGALPPAALNSSFVRRR